MAADKGKSDWVARVLGVRTGNADTGSVLAEPLLPLWVEAKDSVDAALSKLQHALLQTEREGLHKIAELGLAGLTDTQGVGMMVALRNLDASPGSAGARRKAAAAAASFRKFLGSNKLIDVIEHNPFGVPLAMRATFGRALDTIETRIGL